MTKEYPHVSVMFEESMLAFEGVELLNFVDGTLGAGGHALGILERHPEIKSFWGCDQDPQAIEIAQERLSSFEGQVKYFRGNFVDVFEALESEHVKNVNGFFLT
jgi:16S rRNA (cytosine1402-N4)-methyltransferase